MRQILKLKGIFTIIIVLTIGFPALVRAQDPGPSPDGLPADVPIDGGLSILIAAGIGYGANKIRTKGKRLI